MHLITDPEGSNQATEQLDQSTLEILGEDLSHDSRGNTTTLHPDLASRWNGFLSKGVMQETKTFLLEKYPRSGNCNLEAPKLNPEVVSSANDITIKRDQHFINAQNLAGSALAALGTAISTLLFNNEEGVDRLQLLENLCDAGKLITELHHADSLARRAYISPSLNKQIKGVFDNSQIDTFLYGSDLLDKIKEAKSIEKMGQELKPVPYISKRQFIRGKNTLNGRSPPVRQQNYQQGGNKINFQTRSSFVPRTRDNRKYPQSLSRPQRQQYRPRQKY